MISNLITILSKLKLFRKIFYSNDWRPKRCTHCLAPDVHIDHVTKDTLNGIPCEVEVTCYKCKNVISLWAYGEYEPPAYAKKDTV